jgi:hypothetical protein
MDMGRRVGRVRPIYTPEMAQAPDVGGVLLIGLAIGIAVDAVFLVDGDRIAVRT